MKKAYRRSRDVTVTLLGELSEDKKKRIFAWKAVVAHLLEVDGPICSLCSKYLSTVDDVSVDHIVPRSMGGSDRLENFRLAHRKCNSARGDGKRHSGSLVLAGIIPEGVASRSPEYRELYKDAKDGIIIDWRAKHRYLIGVGRRFSILEWIRIQYDVHAVIWCVYVQQGEEAAMAYEPAREEFGLA